MRHSTSGGRLIVKLGKLIRCGHFTASSLQSHGDQKGVSTALTQWSLYQMLWKLPSRRLADHAAVGTSKLSRSSIRTPLSNPAPFTNYTNAALPKQYTIDIRLEENRENDGAETCAPISLKAAPTPILAENVSCRVPRTTLTLTPYEDSCLSRRVADSK